MRKELSVGQEDGPRARQVAISIRIPQLTDCKLHFDEEARRSGEETHDLHHRGPVGRRRLVSCRDVNTQAIFTLKGKPLNVHGPQARRPLQERRALQHDARAQHRGRSVEGLRYNKVVLATDADVDGMHIRNLLLTYFLRFFEELVTRATCSSWRRRSSACATRRRRATATPRPSATWR
jgi:topoisomerase-4 subunit B